jgi:hypothetical protein
MTRLIIYGCVILSSIYTAKYTVTHGEPLYLSGKVRENRWRNKKISLHTPAQSNFKKVYCDTTCMATLDNVTDIRLFLIVFHLQDRQGK